MSVVLGKVLVVGGGIGGLAAALSLRRRGYLVEVFERAESAEQFGAGIILTVNARRALRQLGVDSQIVASGNAVSTMSLADLHGARLSSLDIEKLGGELGMTAIALHRQKLQGLLVEALDGVTIHWDKRLVSLHQGGGVVEARFHDGSVASGNLLVGADGLHSAVRECITGATLLRYSGQRCWRGVCDWSAPLGDVTSKSSMELWGAGIRFGFVRIDPQRVYWYATETSAADQRLSPAARGEYVARLVASWLPICQRLVAATRSESILEHDLCDVAPSETWWKDNVVLLGDAIHPSTPNLGQGAAMAIESAVVLGASLGRGDTLSVALSDYQRARSARTRLVTERSWLIGRMTCWSNSMVVGMRDALVRLTPKFISERDVRALLRFDVEGAA